MSAIALLVQARLKEFVREPSAVFWTFGFPLLITVALGVAFRTQGTPQTVVALVSGPSSATIAKVLAEAPELAVDELSLSQAQDNLHRGTAALVVYPSDDGKSIRYLFDPLRPEAKATRALANSLLQNAAGRQDPLRTQDETQHAQGTRYIDWLVPGLIGMQLMSGGMWGMSWAIVQARQRKLLKRLMATPMRRRDYLLSFVLSRLLFLFIEVPVILLFAYVTFDVAVRGSLWALGAMVVVGSASFAGIGLLCASRAQNTETANGLVNLVQMPMFVLSGVFFSSTRFPELIQPVLKLLPLTALNDGMRMIVNDGAGLAEVGWPLTILGVWGVIPFVVAIRIFRWV